MQSPDLTLKRNAEAIKAMVALQLDIVRTAEQLGQVPREPKLPDEVAKLVLCVGGIVNNSSLADIPSTRISEFTCLEESLADLLLQVLLSSNTLSCRVISCAVVKNEFLKLNSDANGTASS